MSKTTIKVEKSTLQKFNDTKPLSRVTHDQMIQAMCEAVDQDELLAVLIERE